MVQPMPQPVPPTAPPAVPLNWQCRYGDAPDGQRVCMVQITQGAQTYALTLPPDVMEQLGQALVDCGRQARTGLIVPSPVLPPGLGGNGHGHPQ